MLQYRLIVKIGCQKQYLHKIQPCLRLINIGGRKGDSKHERKIVESGSRSRAEH